MSWILDVIFFAVILIGILVGVQRGFIDGICKLAGKLFAVAIAVLCCNALSLKLEEWFGLTTALVDAIGNENLAGVLSVAIAFASLVIITLVGAWALGAIGTALADGVKVFGTVNHFLGGILGLAKAVVLLFLVLTACYWIVNGLHLQAMGDFISSSTVVGSIYKWDKFIELAHFNFLIKNK